MIVRPITIEKANAVVAQWHRHNDPVRGGRFALVAMHEGRQVAVAIVGRTTARELHDDLTAEVTRLCAVDGAPKNACSFLYGVCRRVWQMMGGVKLITYTLQSESGASLRAAGFVPTATLKKRKTWNCKSRPRRDQEVYTEPKIRWDAIMHPDI